MNKFPLIDEIGLKITEAYRDNWKSHTVLASDLEAVLAKGVSVAGVIENGEHVKFSEIIRKEETHYGLLINIKELKQPTADELLEEIRKVHRGVKPIDDIMEKIQAYLERKRK